MKKIFFIIIMCLATITGYANNFTSIIANDSKSAMSTLYNDGKEVVSTVYNDGKSVISDLYPDVKSAIVSIAQGIGVAAEHVYTVLVKKYIVIGVKEALILLIGIFFFIFGFVSIYKYIKNNQYITWKVIPMIILCFLGFLVAYNVNYDDLLMGLINPEFGAINYILEYAKNLV